LWKSECRKAIAQAERKAQGEYSEARQRHPAIVATAEREFREQAQQLQKTLEKADALEKGTQEAPRVVQARLAAWHGITPA
jgi:vacuolar-type H+-ATPase subunit H